MTSIDDAMKLLFSDYDGPTGLLIATGKEMLPLDSIAGATAFVGAGMQSGTTNPEESAQIQSEGAICIRWIQRAGPRWPIGTPPDVQ